MALPMPRSLFVAAMVLAPLLAQATPAPDVTLTIRNHRFIPAQVTVPADTEVTLTVVNKDPTAEEFESHELRREKIVAGGSTIIVRIGPLKPGRYTFFGDFNQATAQGVLIAR